MGKITQYDLVILGNDPQVETLLEMAGRELTRIAWVTMTEVADVLLPWNVDHFVGPFRFETAQQIFCLSADGRRDLKSQRIVIATGTTPRRPSWLPDHSRIYLADQISPEKHFADKTAIIGLGRTGLQMRSQLAKTCDHLVCIDASTDINLNQWSKNPRRDDRRQSIYLGNGLAGIEVEKSGLKLFLEDSQTVLVDEAILCVGRVGNTAHLQLENAGLSVDDSKRIWCNSDYQTWTPGIYAIGSVVGYAHRMHPDHSECELVLEAMLQSQNMQLLA
ncbi:FAD-dependent oxidoreductase [Rubinisphaera sp.]|uniref:FAD-dependent oxidoreductase n=1 Tax=Rubinisphaera sp. TaxID=2024857 RepID=UPI000C0DB1F2|nr:FAD-dependent oxidoreductase [Rubinisphaera sp.]MBV08481.1 hypothetical protein [Rubinisphaera sp.]HCS51447.1 hypothetical protein [Planctomycetaceae bacterium]|tara:strand:+ start:1866 stop:2693 length:828 start_codon:yes stop_codon:yes gene_type:complete